jgi:hypothetical protein
MNRHAAAVRRSAAKEHPTTWAHGSSRSGTEVPVVLTRGGDYFSYVAKHHRPFGIKDLVRTDGGFRSRYGISRSTGVPVVHDGQVRAVAAGSPDGRPSITSLPFDNGSPTRRPSMDCMVRPRTCRVHHRGTDWNGEGTDANPPNNGFAFDGNAELTVLDITST